MKSNYRVKEFQSDKVKGNASNSMTQANRFFAILSKIISNDFNCFSKNSICFSFIALNVDMELFFLFIITLNEIRKRNIEVEVKK